MPLKVVNTKGGFYTQKMDGKTPVGKPKANKRKFAQAADSLRKLGYDITYKANDRKTFRQRGIIRRLYEEKKSYINFADFNTKGKVRTLRGVEYNFKFQKLTTKQRKQALQSGLFSKEQFTKGGLFIEKPVNLSAREYKVEFTDSGVKFKGGARKDVVVRMDSNLLAVDPRKAAEKAIGKRNPKQVSLMVNGFRASHLSGSLRQFYFYLEEELLPQWMKRNEKYFDEEGEAVEQFTDIFHLRLLF